MNLKETADLLAVAFLVDGKDVDPPTVRYWQKLLEDVPANVAHAAMIAHQKCSEYPLRPAHITAFAEANAPRRQLSLSERYPGRKVIQ